MSRTLRIGTRASALALWQANRVADLIRAQPGAPAVELVHIKTEGDMRTDVPLWAVDGRAFFTKEIDRALLANEIDVAVHSLKDLSTVLETGVELVAVVERQDPRDALLCRVGRCRSRICRAALAVGTSSLRRRAFLAHLRPDIEAMELRGNVPTRVEKLEKGEYDAIILASAGSSAWGSTSTSPRGCRRRISSGGFARRHWCCARAGDAEAAHWMKALDIRARALETTAERALLRHRGWMSGAAGALAIVRVSCVACMPRFVRSMARSCSSASGDAEATEPARQRWACGSPTELIAKGAASLIARSAEREGQRRRDDAHPTPRLPI